MKRALPSARSMILSSAPIDLPQASMTKASFTATQAMVSTPFALRSSDFATKPGRCFKLHVGVNAPGTAKRTTCDPCLAKPLCLSFYFLSRAKLRRRNLFHITIGIKIIELGFWKLKRGKISPNPRGTIYFVSYSDGRSGMSPNVGF